MTYDLSASSVRTQVCVAAVSGWPGRTLRGRWSVTNNPRSGVFSRHGGLLTNLHT